MKLKTALELLGDDRLEHVTCGVGWHGEYVTLTVFQLERFARRAREEAYEMAAKYIGDRGFTILAKEIRALPTEPVINQCDGCRAGHPLHDGIHKPVGSKPWDGQAMACTRDRYEGPQGDDWEVGIDNDDRD